MLEVKEIDEKGKLYFNNEELQASVIKPLGFDDSGDEEFNKYIIIPHQNHVINLLLSLKAKSVNFPVVFEIHNWFQLNGFKTIPKITVSRELNQWILSITILPILKQWKFNYSFDEYVGKFLKLWKAENSNVNFEEIEKTFTFDGSVFELNGEVKIEDLDLPFEKELMPLLKLVKKVHLAVVDGFIEENQAKSLATVFKFPEEIQSYCEQYLLYFAQFLKDLVGIETTSTLKEETGKVLFSVTPTDDIEALDKIREALAVYLNLPASPIVYDDSFAATRLKKEIESLHFAQNLKEMELRSAQYTLRLAQQTVESQDKSLQQKDVIIEQQNRIIEKITSKSIMIDSVQNKEELEELYDGVKVGESEALKKYLGISLNPAKAIKTAVKNTFGKSENKSVLGLEDEIGGNEK